MFGYNCSSKRVLDMGEEREGQEENSEVREDWEACWEEREDLEEEDEEPYLAETEGVMLEERRCTLLATRL